MRFISRIHVLGGVLGLLLVGCAVTPRRTIQIVEVAPEEAVLTQAALISEAGGFSVVGEGASLTLPMAQDKAIRRARLALSEAVLARVQQVKADFIAATDSTETTAVDTWFSGVSDYLRELIVGGTQPVVEQSEQKDGLVTVWVVMTEDPATIVQAMEMRGVTDRQTYELIRASEAYRSLLAEAEQFATYKASQRSSLL
jgi:hypothetical protein